MGGDRPHAKKLRGDALKSPPQKFCHAIFFKQLNGGAYGFLLGPWLDLRGRVGTRKGEGNETEEGEKRKRRGETRGGRERRDVRREGQEGKRDGRVA